MQTFQDSKNRVWTISLTLGGAKRVKDVCNIDLLNPVSITDDGRPLTSRLLFDDLLLAEIVSTIISRELEGANIKREEWLESVDAKTIASIQDAFVKEYRDFFTARNNDLYLTALEASLKEAQDATAKLKATLSTGETSSSSQVEQESQTIKSTLGSSLVDTQKAD